MIRNSGCICHDRERWVYAGGSGERAAINGVQVFHLVRLAPLVQYRLLRVHAHTNGAVLVRAVPRNLVDVRPPYFPGSGCFKDFRIPINGPTRLCEIIRVRLDCDARYRESPGVLHGIVQFHTVGLLREIMHDDANSHAVVKELPIGILHGFSPLRLVRQRKIDRQGDAGSSRRNMATANKAALLVRRIEFKCTGTNIATTSPTVDRLFEYTNGATVFMEGEIATDESIAVCQPMREAV